MATGTEKPLSKYLLGSHKTRPNTIGVNYGPSYEAHENAVKLCTALRQEGISFEKLHDKKTSLKPTPCGAQITGESNIAKFLAAGGVVSRDNTLQAFKFESEFKTRLEAGKKTFIIDNKPRTTEETYSIHLTYDMGDADAAARLKKLFDAQGIKYTQTDTKIHVSDLISVKAIAFSGGTFDGAQQLKNKGMSIQGTI